MKTVRIGNISKNLMKGEKKGKCILVSSSFSFCGTFIDLIDGNLLNFSQDKSTRKGRIPCSSRGWRTALVKRAEGLGGL